MTRLKLSQEKKDEFVKGLLKEYVSLTAIATRASIEEHNKKVGSKELSADDVSMCEHEGKTLFWAKDTLLLIAPSFFDFAEAIIDNLNKAKEGEDGVRHLGIPIVIGMQEVKTFTLDFEKSLEGRPSVEVNLGEKNRE